jgi:hypothetical protein
MEWFTAFIISLTAAVSAIGALVVTILKTKKNIEQSLPKKLLKQCDLNTEIIQRMEQIKEILRADRIQIYDFHNGGHYANGRSALKTSCTFEVVRVGVKGYQMYLQSLPLSAIPEFVKTLLNNKELYVKNLEEIKGCMPSTYNIKHSQDVKGFYDIILENEKQEPIGFLGIQYTTEALHRELTLDEKNEIFKLKFFIESKLEEMIKKV